MKTHWQIILFVIIIMVQGCTKEIDFNQIDDVEINPVVLLTLVDFNLNASNFLDDNGNETYVLADAIQANLSDDSEKYLKQVQVNAITENSFNSNFSFQIVLFNAAKQPIYKLEPTIFIPSNSGATTHSIEIPTNDIHFLYDTTYFGFIVTLLNDSGGNNIITDDGVLNLKSSIELFFNFKVE